MREIPLFPLNVVLFPGGRLPLQIFEPRYLRMITESMRAQAPFGIIRVTSGSEVQQPDSKTPGLASVGCFAEVIDFDQLPNGLLGITAIGRGRFRLHDLRVEDDGLNVGKVEPLDERGRGPISEHLQPLADLARGWTQDPQWSATGIDLDPDDATSLSGRLAELLPLELDEKQRLLEMDDPAERLEVIAERISSLSAAG